MPRFLSVLRASLTLLASTAAAQTIVVTTPADTVDFALPQTVAQLPGPDGAISFREALMATDNTPGPQTVAFAIPRASWNEQFFPGRAMLDLEGPLVLSSNDNVIDFTTQAAFTGDTNPTGNEVGIQYYGPPSNISFIFVHGNRNTIRGLDVTTGNAFGASINLIGSDNIVESCTSVLVEIGGNFGGPPASRNVVRTSRLYEVSMTCWANDNIVVGNRLTHLRIEGSRYCVYPTGNRVGGPAPDERNVISGYGRFGEEGLPTGSQIDVVWARDTVIEGNYVGTTPDGMAPQPSQIGPGGVTVRDAENTVIRGNLIAGLRSAGFNHYAGQIFGDAIAVVSTNADTVHTRVVGNTIGLGADGLTPIPTRRGIIVAAATARQRARSVVIGGPEPEDANVIASLETFGVLIGSLESGVHLSRNAIYDCGTFPIELTRSTGADGPTPNDQGDADAGANGLQNHPVLTTAAMIASGVRVSGVLSSTPMDQFAVEMFASPACLPSGRGEARRFLGSQVVATDSTGTAAFEVDLPAAMSAGEFISATATRLVTGDTSEIGPCILAELPASCDADFNRDGVLDPDDLGDFINCFFSGPVCQGADFNADGAIDADDLGDLINAYFAGC